MSFKSPRELRIFISSTFLDLAKEREGLMTRVFPKVSRVSTLRGVTLTPIDLRWGVLPNGEVKKSYSTQVIDSCLKEIDRADCFIGIIGERDGWHPKPEDLKDSALLLGPYERLANSGYSITEIEIQYGALLRDITRPTFFFLKNLNDGTSEDTGNRSLRDTINKEKGKKNYQLIHYSSPNELESLVECSFIELLDSLYPPEKSTKADIEDEQQAFLIESLTKDYIPNDYYLNQIEEGLCNGQYVHVTGDKGSGKSALLAYWIKLHSDDSDRTVIWHFIDKNGDNSPEHIISRLCRLIVSTGLCQGNETESNQVDPMELRILCLKLLPESQLVIVLDNVSTDTTFMSKLLPELPGNVKVIFSSPFFDGNSFWADEKDSTTVCLMDDDKQRESFVRTYCMRHGKVLDDLTIRQVVKWLPGSYSVLWAFMQLLVSFGTHNGLHTIIDNFASTNGWSSDPVNNIIQKMGREVIPTTGFYNKLLDLLLSYYTEIPFKDILSAVSFAELMEEEIAPFLGIEVQDWFYFVSVFGSFITKVNGILRISDEEFGSVISKRFNPYRERVLERATVFFDEDDDICRRYKARLDYDLAIGDVKALIRELSSQCLNRAFLVHDRRKLSWYWNEAMTLSRETDTLYEFINSLYEQYNPESLKENPESLQFIYDFSRFCIQCLGCSTAARITATIAYNAGAMLWDQHHPFCLKCLATIAESYIMEEKWSEAISLLDEAIDCYEETKVEMEEYAECLRLRSEAEANIGAFSASHNDIIFAQILFLARFGEESEPYVKSLLTEGRLFIKEDAGTRARKCFIKAHHIASLTAGESSLLLSETRLELAQALLRSKEYDLAFDLALYSSIDSLHNNNYYNAVNNLSSGLVFYKLKQYEDALNAFDSAETAFEINHYEGSLLTKAREYKQKCERALWLPNLFDRIFNH